VTQVLAVDRAALLSAVAPEVGSVFNTAFFLLEPDDVRGHHSAIHEPVGLWVDEGVIRRPPLYSRGTLIHEVGRRWSIDRFSLRDVRVELPGGLVVVPQPAVGDRDGRPCTVDDEDDISLYTRASVLDGVPTVRDRTPLAPQREEFTVVDRRVVGQKRGGGLLIPQNGFIVSFHRSRNLEAPLRELTAAAMRVPVTYRWRHQRHAGIDRALQAGPTLFTPGGPKLEGAGP
jgi:hypothetical protein